MIAACLVPLFVAMAVFNLIIWMKANFIQTGGHVDSIKDINKIFFDEFFTVLILTDVLLLLVSLLYTHQFSTVIRNSAFIISTILIKMSFGNEGFIGTVLTVVAVAIGVVTLLIQNQYEKLDGHNELQEHPDLS